MTDNDLKLDYKGVQESGSGNVHPGFSIRLHRFIDQVDGLDIPGSEERGRLSAIAKITGHSKPSISDWFKKDKLPSEEVFTSLVRFFMQYIDCNESLVKVESWIRYGSEATSDPFENTVKNKDYERLKSLALNLLSVVVRDDNISIKDTDLDSVLEDTVLMLENFGVTDSEDVPELIYSLIRSFINKHAK